MVYDNITAPTVGKVTFEDNDGMELIQASDGQYIIIQEDSGNIYGERMFIAKLEHEDDGKELQILLVGSWPWKNEHSYPGQCWHPYGRCV